MPLPAYHDLPENVDGVRSAWGLFGDRDSVGLFNQLDESAVRRAARLVKLGQVFALNAPLDYFDPPLFGRPALRREIQPARVNWGFNEVLSDFNPQASSQWDGLSHVSYRANHFYNDASFDEIAAGKRNTVDHWARRGLAGRGVLLDLVRTADAEGKPFDPATSHAFGVADLEAARVRAGVEYEPGDILVLRTGFTQWYAAADPAERARMSVRETMTACGIAHTEEMARYLWDSHVSAVASDCPAVEVWPMDHSRESFPFGCLHQILLGQFGMALGELWWLDELAAACETDGVHEFLLTSAPMNYPSFGSPANALAIR